MYMVAFPRYDFFKGSLRYSIKMDVSSLFYPKNAHWCEPME